MTRHVAAAGRAVSLVIAVAALTAVQAQAQDYPTRTVRIIVPYPAGGTTDILARMVGDRLQQKLGQPFVIENRPGAGTAIGAAATANAAPDGYTLLVSTASTTAFMPLLRQNPGYTANQIIPVAMVGRAPLVLDVPTKSPFRTVKDLVDFAKANPGKLNGATQGAGATSHLTAELLRASAGITYQPVHYRGSAPGLMAAIAGEIDFYFDGVATSAPAILGGNLRGLAITSEKRAASLPDVPTMREAGYPDVTVYSWYGFLAPAGTPAAIVELLNKEITAIVKDAAVNDRLQKEGAEPISMTPPDFARFINEEREMWRGVITKFNIQLE